MLRRLKVIFLYIKTDLYLINPSPPPPPSQRLKEPEAGYTVFPGIAPPPRKLIPHLTDPSTLGLPYIHTTVYPIYHPLVYPLYHS
jgi:hypothetical protein